MATWGKIIYVQTEDWVSLAWWIHHHIDGYKEMTFFPKQCVFNIRWFEDSAAPKTIKTFIANPHTKDKTVLLNKGSVHPYYTGKASFANRLFSVQEITDKPLDLGYFSHCGPYADI
ncbi:MAG: hypothetical protein O3A63_01965 [Proteobacteria bacterium]|nr:hypothetical protein [Pseudomonadota bacterium]